MGEVAFGKFRLIAELGHGGMADVFLAVMAGPAGSGFSKLTVVKRLRENLADEPEFVEMLVDEARISGRLNHPNVVQTNEVGSVDGQYFISMEYLDGQPLHRILHRASQRFQKLTAAALESGGEPPVDPFPRECQVLVIVDALAGLHHAHQLADYDGTPLEVVHRDVTPHNIFVTYEGQTKVVDFGIAKAVGRASETRQGVVKGKVRYMAPEQATGHKVDRRADIFSVGVMLWEAATGRRLWKDMDDLQIVQSLVTGHVMTSPREVDPTVPEELDRICQKALAETSTRYATAEEFRADLESYLADAGLLLKSRRKLGPAVSELFADKRAEIRSIIEKQLALLKARQAAEHTGSDGALGAVRIASSSRFSAAPASALSVPPHNAGGTLPHAFPAPTPEQAPSLSTSYDQAHYATGTSTVSASASALPIPAVATPRPRPLFTFVRVVTLVAVAVLVFAAVGFVTTRVKARHLAASPPEAKADVHLKLTVVPPNAIVSIDGAPVATPNDARFPRDGHEHQVRVEAPGFEPHVESLQLDNDLAMSVVLTMVRPPAGKKPPLPSAKPVASAPAKAR